MSIYVTVEILAVASLKDSDAERFKLATEAVLEVLEKTPRQDE